MWKNLFIKIIVSSIAVMVCAHILPGVHLSNYTTALLLALVLSFLNVFIKPILIALTIPFTLFSFGLFLLVINALILLLGDYLVDGFELDGFWYALLFSIVLSILTSILESFSKTKDADVEDGEQDNFSN
ncbi:MAG: phage holin family protein [Bacteroidia bacterium]|nr:phage holin family protein [Bacteroidia bacterium]